MSQDLSSAAEALDDAELVRRTTRGELSAFEQLVDRPQAGRDARGGPHRRLRRGRGRQPGRVPARVPSPRPFRGDAPFRSWLLRITHNAALDHLARRRPEPVDPETLDTSESRTARPPADRLEVRERIERLERKLRGLAPQHRLVLVLRDAEGLSYEAIAEITDTPLGSVKGRLHRARREFIEMLRTNTYDWELPR
jgi:RNA polymerase sigma-70 factor, ECF subfamily